MAINRWVFLFFVSGMLLGYSLGLLTSKSTKIEAQLPTRFQIQKSDENQMKICDTQNGNTISFAYNEDGYHFEISTQEKCKNIPDQ